jgi:GTP cyclohydrolase I
MNTSIEKELFELIGDNHQMTSAETPMRPDAFIETDQQKMSTIEKHFHI